MSAGRRYIGVRGTGGAQVFVEDDGRRLPLRHVKRHSPSGLEWGYAGSGPADLACSVLSDLLGTPSVHPILYQAFKADVIAGLAKEGFSLPADAVRAWLGKRWATKSDVEISAEIGRGGR